MRGPKIIYEDNHLLVVEKPVNLPAQADESGDTDLVSVLKEYLKIKYDKPGNVYLGLVHRLDRPVGGVMVLAKTSKAASRLSKQVRERQIQKIYLAVVHGVPKPPRGTLTDYLKKDSTQNMVRVVQPNTEGAKEACLDYEVLKKFSGLSLACIHLHTGRSHQIRVQMAAAGYPLFGDQKYGAGLNKPGQQLALWSWRLSFIHPVLKEQVSFFSKPPVNFPWDQFQLDSLEM